MPKQHKKWIHQVCKCGEDMVVKFRHNSGTTESSQACPVLLAHYGDGWEPWDALPGHQCVITSRPDHDPRCCSIREVVGR